MAEQNQIMSGLVTFTTDGFFIQLTDNGPFVDLSGPAVFRPGFDEEHFDHQHASVLAQMGERAIGGSSGGPAVRSLVAERIVSHLDVATRAYYMFQADGRPSAFDNWLRAERESLER